MVARIYLAWSRHLSLACLLAGWAWAGEVAGQDRIFHSFERQRLTDVYFSEGANAGDLNHDGIADVVYGPYWFEGPSLTKRHEIYPPTPQNREQYADNFFSWVYDFNDDGWSDVFVVGFPGTPAFVYENPGKAGASGHWKKHQVIDEVSNESPQFTNLVGDERPELVCTRGGFFGFATIDWKKPFEAWNFHAISEPSAPARFGHGLGVGDVNGDGRLDILHVKGWFEQPAEGAITGRWASHSALFGSSYGGAEMYAYDVDGDGDNDVITSIAAHEFGLAWYEQQHAGDKVIFKEHLIMGESPSFNRYCVVFSELHSLRLADIDGDGLKDIVTGKTYYSHHKQSPMWDAGAVVYWFRLVRGPTGVDWVPYKADGEAGIGRQVSVADLNGDGLLDIVVGGMKGAHVLRHQKQKVDEATWAKAQPKVNEDSVLPKLEKAKRTRGGPASIDAKTGRVPGAMEAEDLAAQVTGGGRTQKQTMELFDEERWSGKSQLWWTGARPGDTLTLPLPPTAAGPADLEIVMTCARDYSIVQLKLDGMPLGDPLDLYERTVMPSGVIRFLDLDLAAGPHKLTVELLGANGQALKSYMVGIDYLKITTKGTAPPPKGPVEPKAKDESKPESKSESSSGKPR